MGIFAYAGIMAGEIVWAEPKEGGPTIAAIPRSRAWIEALPPASRHPTSPCALRASFAT